MSTPPPPLRVWLHPACLWGIGGVLALLVHAILHLTPIASQVVSLELGPGKMVFCALWVVFMAYTEGYRGFQKSFSPRVVSRALTLPSASRLSQLLAPLYCMTFFHSTRRRVVASWILWFCIIGFIIGIRLLPHEWRVILDVGVVVGLGWGSLSIIGHAVQVLRGRSSLCDPELP